MTQAEIEIYCLSKSGAFTDYPFGPDVTVVKVKSANSPARIFTQLFMLGGSSASTRNVAHGAGRRASLHFILRPQTQLDATSRCQ